MNNFCSEFEEVSSAMLRQKIWIMSSSDFNRVRLLKS